MNDQERLLTILYRLQEGEELNSRKLSEEMDVSKKTIQRDFFLLRDFLDLNLDYGVELAYNAKTYSRYLKQREAFGKKDVLLLIKILLATRSLSTNQLKLLVSNLVRMLPKTDQVIVKHIIASELLHYQPIFSTQNNHRLLTLIWDLAMAIENIEVIEISYTSPGREAYSHKITPMSIYFDNSYFYVVGYKIKNQERRTYRIDRIESMKVLNERSTLNYKDKYRDGEERQYMVDANEGDIIQLDIKVFVDPSYLLDRFSNVTTIKREDGSIIYRVQAKKGYGLTGWILSQGTGMKVVGSSDTSFLSELKNHLRDMLKQYE